VLGLDPLHQSNGLRERTGLMLQQGGIYPHITVREAIRLFAAYYPRSEDPDEMLRQVGLEQVARSRYRNLSGGEKQRLSLALALVGRPELVFLDEPTTAMDPQARHATWGIIRDLRARGATVLLTTHFMDEADFLADRVGILNHGRLVALDTPAGLRQDLSRGIQVTTDRPVDVPLMARRIGVAEATVLQESDRRLLLRLDPSPNLVARVTAALAEEGILVTELHCGSRSLEQAYLALTGESVNL
jgi:ABC-2 type transport system ATP-binding protein